MNSSVKAVYGHTGDKVDVLPALIKPKIDGEFTRVEQCEYTELGKQLQCEMSHEWADAERITLIPMGQYGRDVYLYLKHDESKLYLCFDYPQRTGRPVVEGGWLYLYDIVAYVQIDALHDGGSWPKENDSTFEIETPSELYVHTGKREIGWGPRIRVSPSDSYTAKSGIGPSANSNKDHAIIEMSISKADYKIGSSPTMGFRAGLLDVERKQQFHSWPKYAPETRQFSEPDLWGDANLLPSVVISRALEAIEEARASIRKAEGEGRTEGLGRAKALLDSCLRAFENRWYELALNLAGQARRGADTADYPRIYYEAKQQLAQAEELEAQARSSNFLSSGTRNLAKQAFETYNQAKEAFSTKEWTKASELALKAIALFDKAFAVESEEIKTQQTRSYLVSGATSVTVVVAIASAVLYLSRKKKPSKAAIP